MIRRCQTFGSALLAAVGLGVVLAAGCAAKPETSASPLIPALTGPQATQDAAGDEPQRDPAGLFDTVRLGLVNRTTALIGRKALTRGEKGLGKVADLILDLPTGQVVAVLISAGAADSLTPVPAQSFWTATKNLILVSTDRKTFKSAPQISKAELTPALELGRLDDTFRHFGQRAPAAPLPGSGGFCSAVGLVGLRLVSQTSEPLGQVEDVMVDVPVGRITFLVVEPAAGTCAPGYLYVVPPQCVRLDAVQRSLVLKADQAHFLAGPHFQQDYWTDMARPELGAAVLQHYDLEPKASAQPVAARQPMRARIETPGAVTPAPTARSEQEITVAIATEIVRLEHAFPTRELTITTVKGHVTLSGRVRTEQQKQQLGATAARVVGAENVDNQLRVAHRGQ